MKILVVPLSGPTRALRCVELPREIGGHNVSPSRDRLAELHHPQVADGLPAWKAVRPLHDRLLIEPQSPPDQGEREEMAQLFHAEKVARHD